MTRSQFWKTATWIALYSAILAGCATGSAQQPAGNSTGTSATQDKSPAAVATGTEETGKTANPRVHEFRLDNGLKILVKQDSRAPVVVSQVWYKAGSSYEQNGTTGVAHVLEHMMFKGTDKYGPNEFSRIISENGGSENAFTGQDYTAYFQQLEKSRLPIAMELEADRMANLNLSAEEFGKEIQVVMEERRMRTDDNPKAKTYELFLATAYTNSPYHHPIIGWMNDLKNMTVEDAQKWYNDWYAPNNATLVVAGDVDPGQVLALAKEHYGRIPPAKVPKLKPQQEVVQNGVRRIVVKEPAQLPYLLMGYKVPVIKTAELEWEPYALEMLAHVLDGSDSSRFTRDLIRGKAMAASIGAGYDLFSRMDELFLFDSTPAQGFTVADLEKEIRAQIERLKTELVTEKELERIKNQVVASKIYEQDSIFYQAMQMGTLETVGLDWRLTDEFVDRFRTVTAEQVQQVAQKYLIDERLTVAVLDPQPINPKSIASNHGGAPHAQ
ncbi:MAG: insulinase family protein [Gammaproteobacteria bacterium]|nr:insulinase family protein [Gammaproteobacteria bacterium]